MKGLTATEGTDTAKLDTGGDISKHGDLGDRGVWKSTGDMRAGVVIAETYLCHAEQRESKNYMLHH